MIKVRVGECITSVRILTHICACVCVWMSDSVRVLPVPLLRSTKQYFNSYSFRISWTSYKDKKRDKQKSVEPRDHQNPNFKKHVYF